MRHTAGGTFSKKPDRAGPTPPRENRNLSGMPSSKDMDRPTANKSRPLVGRTGTRPGKGW